MNSEKYQALALHPRTAFILACMSFFVGISSGSTGDMSMLPYIFALGFVISLTLIFSLSRGIFFIVLLSTWFLWVSLAQWAYETRMWAIGVFDGISEQYGGKLSLTGTLEKRLYKTESSQAYRLSFANFDMNSPQKDIKILVELPVNLRHWVWDSITIKGKVVSLYASRLEWFEKYTFFQNLAGKVRVDGFSIIESGEIGILERVGIWTEKQIFRWFPRDSAWVLLGMTIWRVDLMGKSIQKDFQISGISHILVVSGSNITFLIVFLSGVLRYFPLRRWLRTGLIIWFVLAYSTLVWWDVPVIRASIMGLIAFFVIERGLRISSIALLLLIWSGFLVFSPLSLLYDAAYGLSFSATLSIILYYRIVVEKLHSWHIPLWLSSILAVTLAASIGTIPMSIYHFWVISFWFFFANVAIALVVGWILFMTVWYILLGFLWDGFLYIFGYAIYVPVDYIIAVSRYFSAWGTWPVGNTISVLVIILSSAIFCVELVRSSMGVPKKDQKAYDRPQ